MEDSATITGSSILSKLQSSSDLSSIHYLFSSYLHPFTVIINKPKRQSKSSKINAEASATIQSLAKTFTSFLNKALNIIPTRLDETPKIEYCYAFELFEVYTICLSCLESVLSVLSSKPLSVQFHLIRLIHCYEDWGRYEDAQNEVLSELEYIGKISGEIGGNLNRGCDASQLCFKRSKQLISMVNEIQPWLRFVDACTYDRLHQLLAICLVWAHGLQCSFFIAG
ncbi:unnamed protein product [Lactuca saligna]|uniref:Separase-like TPR repeats region domain-containing protein n=1 Tax=Lactuca saligna TaxID=75948 RepID=A0AA36EJP9_LACSI|nr:unnamed protein product [Lactuca saligna]